MRCHADFVHDIVRGSTTAEDAVKCVHCHRGAGTERGRDAKSGMPASRDRRRRSAALLVGIAVVCALLVFLVAGLLTSIFERKQEAQESLRPPGRGQRGDHRPGAMGSELAARVRRLPAHGGADQDAVRRVGVVARGKGRRVPWLTRMFAGYAFALDYRDRRGHAYMLQDQEQTRRVTERPQPGSCLQCHASVIPTYRRLGSGDVFAGFEALGKLSYQEAHAEVVKTGSSNPVPRGGATPSFDHVDGAHPVSCVDCHDAASMELRVTRPGFIRGIQALAVRRRAGPAPREHRPVAARQPSHALRPERRRVSPGDALLRLRPVPRRVLLRAEDDLVLPLEQRPGGRADRELLRRLPVPRRRRLPRLDARRDRRRGAQGAASGVRDVEPGHPCAQRRRLRRLPHAVQARGRDEGLRPLGAKPAAQRRARLPGVPPVLRGGDPRPRRGGAGPHASFCSTGRRRRWWICSTRWRRRRQRASSESELAPILALHRKAQWRLDFVAAENSMGFHAPQETARVLAEAIDYARQGQLAARMVAVAAPAARD